MEQKGKRLCIFLHYFPEGYFPLYVQYFLNELTNYFDEVKMVTNRRTITQHPELLYKSVTIQFEDNEAYDLGLFSKGFNSINPSEYDQIACINDSIIIFGKLKFLFDWSEKHHADFWGLVDSREKPWFSKHSDNYHIQSHFIVFNKKSILKLKPFIEQLNLPELVLEKDPKKLRRKVINDWEIGLTQFLLQQDLTCRTYIDNCDYEGGCEITKPENVFINYYAELIKRGIPIIKKRIITDNRLKKKNKHNENWRELLKIYGEKNWKIDQIIDELTKIEATQNKRLFAIFVKKVAKLFCV